MGPLSVPNFSPIGAHICVLWWILRSVQKKVEEKIPNFGRLYLGSGRSNFLQIWNVDTPT